MAESSDKKQLEINLTSIFDIFITRVLDYAKYNVGHDFEIFIINEIINYLHLFSYDIVDIYQNIMCI